MSDPIIRVFLSSTWLDLQPERNAVEKVIHRIEETKFVGMEYFGSRNEEPRTAALADVDKSDLYIGILGPRYGSGITEDEYKRARENGIPCFWFVMEGDVLNGYSTDDPEKHNAFRESFSKHHIWSTFSSPGDLAAKVATAIHLWLKESGLSQKGHKTLIHKYVNGVRSLPFDYAARIENFLNEYLGTPFHPVAFGARDDELKALDSWFEGDEESSYLMLAAPAGRGKSALLVHWSRQVQKREDIELAFVPVSIRFRTNLSGVVFATLAARLAKIHGEEIKETSTMTVEMWRGLITEYLTRPLPGKKKLLVIIDGLDEAADWQAGPDLFPNNPPENLKILTSARFKAGDKDAEEWLHRLGWGKNNLGNVLELDLVSKNGLRGVLDSMGFPIAQLSTRVDIVKEIFRLSEGDPLLVQIYIQDLWQKGAQAVELKPEELNTIKPGLDGYFRRWWADQELLWEEKKIEPLEKEATEAILNLLAFAIGPLLFADIMQLTGEEYGLNSSSKVRRALKPLSRFIIGDGIDQGFVFTHPKLGYYFIDQIASNEKNLWEDRFLNWGREVITSLKKGNIKPGEVSDYLVQYIGAHFERSNVEINDRMLLVDRKWCEAWEFNQEGFSGFLNDIKRAKLKARKLNRRHISKGEKSPYLGKEIKCLLFEVTLKSLSIGVDEELPCMLHSYGIWNETQVLFLADQMIDYRSRNKILAYALGKFGKEWSIPILAIINSKKDDADLFDALKCIVPILDHSLVNEILELIYLIKNRSYRSQILVKLVDRFSSFDTKNLLIKETFDSISEMNTQTNGNEAERVIESLSFHLTGQEQIEEAIKIVRLIKYYPARLKALMHVVSISGSERKQKLLREALIVIEEMKYDFERKRAFREISKHLDSEVLVEAIELAKKIKTDDDRIEALVYLDPVPSNDTAKDVLLEAHNKEGDHVMMSAFKTARSIKSSYERARALAQLALSVSDELKENVLLEAIDAAEEDMREEFLVTVLRELAPQLTDFLFHKALRIVDRISNDSKRAQGLHALLPYLTRETLPIGVTIARGIEDHFWRSKTLANFALRLNVNKQENVILEAFESAKLISDSYRRAKAVTNLVPLLKVSAQKEALAEAYKAAIIFQDSQYLPNMIERLAPYLKNNELKKIITLTRLVEDHSDYAKILSSLAPIVDIDTLTLAIQAAKSIPDESIRVVTLRDLAIQLKGKARAELLAQALVISRLISSDEQTFRVLHELIPHLTGELFKAAILTAKSIKSDHYFALTIQALMPHLNGSVIDETLPVLSTREDESMIARVLGRLAPRMNENQHRVAFEIALGIRDKLSRAESLVSLAPHSGPDELVKIVEAVKHIESDSSRVRTLEKLAPSLSGNSLMYAAEIAMCIQSGYFKSKALVSLGFPLEDGSKKKVLEEILDKVRVMSSEISTEILAIVAPFLDDAALADALEITQEVEFGYYCASALRGLVPFLKGEKIKDALEIARAIEYPPARTIALTSIALKFNDESRRDLLREVLEVTEIIESNQVRVERLEVIALHLNAEELATLARMTLGIVEQEKAIWPLEKLVAYFNSDALIAAIKGISSIKNEQVRAQVIGFLAPYFTGEMLPKVIEAAYTIEDPEFLARSLSRLIPFLDDSRKESFLEKNIRTISNISNEESRSNAIVDLGAYYNEKTLPKAISVVNSIRDEKLRSDALVSLGAFCSKKILPKIIIATKSIENKELRASTFISLVQCSNNAEIKKLITDSLSAVYAVNNESVRYRMLIDLSSCLEEEKIAEVVEMIREADDDYLRAVSLLDLMELVPQHANIQSYEMLIDILDNSSVRRINNYTKNSSRVEHINNWIGKLAKHIYIHGDDESMKDLVFAIEEVNELWP